MISVGPASWLIVQCGENLDFAVFWDTINVINVKLCMIIVLIELYSCMPLSVISTIFQGQRSVKQFFFFKLVFVC